MSVVAIVRDVGPLHHSVLDVLGDHLEVLWGALLAFVIVVLLTPAVGQMARRFGVVDSPGRPAAEHPAHSAPRRDRALLRDLRAGARVRARSAARRAGC